MVKEFHRPEQERTFATKPPNPIDALAYIYRAWRQTCHSEHIPRDYNGAAQWWIDHQEPRGNQEILSQETTPKGEKVWKDPFIVRLVVNFRIFLTSFSDIEKSYIVNKIEGGIPWRGDDLEFFKMICEQEEVMQKDKHAFIENTLKAMREFKFSGVAQ